MRPPGSRPDPPQRSGKRLLWLRLWLWLWLWFGWLWFGLVGWWLEDQDFQSTGSQATKRRTYIGAEQHHERSVQQRYRAGAAQVVVRRGITKAELPGDDDARQRRCSDQHAAPVFGGGRYWGVGVSTGGCGDERKCGLSLAAALGTSDEAGDTHVRVRPQQQNNVWQSVCRAHQMRYRGFDGSIRVRAGAAAAAPALTIRCRSARTAAERARLDCRTSGLLNPSSLLLSRSTGSSCHCCCGGALVAALASLLSSAAPSPSRCSHPLPARGRGASDLLHDL